jgi:copper transport protein
MRAITLLLALMAVLASASAVHAHASLIRSEPADRAVVAQAPPELKLTFNEPVSPLVLRLVRPSGELVELKGTVAPDGATIVLELPPGTSLGTHLLSWRVVSADGHPVGGALTFSIGQPSAAPTSPQSTDTRLRVAVWLARLALYMGLFIGIGGAFFGTWIAASQPSGWVRTATIGALECGLIAALLSIGLHGADVLGLALADIREMRVWGSGVAGAYGLTLCVAAAASALGLAALTAEGPITRWCSGLALAGVGAALATSGHASTAGPALVTRPAVFLHGVCVAFWLGALLPLAAGLASGHDRMGLVRFSKSIPWPFVLLIASGMLLAIIQVQQVEALWTTRYGVILSCKLGAVCLLLGLAAMNRRVTPRVVTGDARAARQVQRSIMAEIAIMLLILGLVASWRFTPPPRALLAATGQPVHAHIHTDRAMADLQIEPTRDEGRRIVLNLLDGQFAPLTVKEVTLVLSRPDAGIEPLRLAAKHVDATMWQIDDVRLPMSGRWRVRIEILISDFEKIAIEDEIDFSKRGL